MNKHSEKNISAREKIMKFSETFDQPRGTSSVIQKEIYDLIDSNNKARTTLAAKIRECDFSDHPRARMAWNQIQMDVERATAEIAQATFVLQKAYDDIQMLYLHVDRIELADAIKVVFFGTEEF